MMCEIDQLPVLMKKWHVRGVACRRRSAPLMEVERRG